MWGLKCIRADNLFSPSAGPPSAGPGPYLTHTLPHSHPPMLEPFPCAELWRALLLILLYSKSTIQDDQMITLVLLYILYSSSSHGLYSIALPPLLHSSSSSLLVGCGGVLAPLRASLQRAGGPSGPPPSQPANTHQPATKQPSPATIITTNYPPH